MIANVSVKTAQTWLMQRKDLIKPWSEFVNSNNFKKPDTIKQWTTRSLKNIENYQANYMFVFIGLILYCMLVYLLLKCFHWYYNNPYILANPSQFNCTY